MFGRRKKLRRLPNGDWIGGSVYIIGTEMDPDYVPPSTSLNPDAPRPTGHECSADCRCAS